MSDLNKIGFKNLDNRNYTDLKKTLSHFKINSVEQIRHFLAQCMFESDYWRSTIEYGHGKGKPYGKKYCGAGYIQLTWEYNYEAFSKYMKNNGMKDGKIMSVGADHVSKYYPWFASGFFWHDNKINNKCKQGKVDDISRIVNRYAGDKVFAAKRQCYKKICYVISGKPKRKI